MKAVKIYWHGKRLKDIYPYATRWEVFKYRVKRFVRKLVIVLCSMGVGYAMLFAAYAAGSHLNPRTVYAEKEVQVIVETDAPVLARIAKCESGNRHYKDGQVIFNANTNGSVDIGKYQINSLWNKKATEMGLDLTKEKDNETFAKYLYANLGTEPWSASKSCWNR